jgi:hypothetical protein
MKRIQGHEYRTAAELLGHTDGSTLAKGNTPSAKPTTA